MYEFNLPFVKKRRLELGITQQELAERLGYKRSSTYLKYESGVYTFKAEQLPVLAEQLKCEIPDFFTPKAAGNNKSY
ncbi:MAG: helix-turn-helix transcriptional regulator [Kurthia sp.]|nr:helix-turn-helix transcriptional regulator [Candidatus Kurthia equi]